MDTPCLSTDTDFEHDALPDAASHIRLLEVLEDNYSETIKVRCRISTWSVDDTPSYHAVSYTWGDTESNTIIMINDKTFRVRTNCEFVLKQACWYNKSCYYWVDAICINQENLEEKSKQVAMMGDIYKTADHVLACVGNHADDSLFFYRELARISAIYEKSRHNLNTLLILCRRPRIFTIRRFLAAAVHFAKRPYFSRLWVVQELKNAKQANLLCGPDILPKKDVNRLFFDLDGIVNPLSKPGSMAISLLRTLRAILCPQTTLELDDRISTRQIISNSSFVTDDFPYTYSLFHEVKPLHCTHRRDKLYGIMSILESGDFRSPIPDYTKTDFEVALDFVQPIFDFMLSKNSMWYPPEVCGNIQSLLDLDDESEGVFDAIEARRGGPETTFAGFRLPMDAPSMQLRSVAKGWRLLGEHFLKRGSLLSEWKLPGSIRSRATLPTWVREGDWILQPETQSSLHLRLLVLREVADGFVSPIMGQGHFERRPTGPADSIFHIHWDTEDLLISVILGFSEVGYPVDIGICKRQTPGSTYAIRQDISGASA